MNAGFRVPKVGAVPRVGSADFFVPNVRATRKRNEMLAIGRQRGPRVHLLFWDVQLVSFEQSDKIEFPKQPALGPSPDSESVTMQFDEHPAAAVRHEAAGLSDEG